MQQENFTENFTDSQKFLTLSQEQMKKPHVFTPPLLKNAVS
jgi:hypothetical protein